MMDKNNISVSDCFGGMLDIQGVHNQRRGSDSGWRLPSLTRYPREGMRQSQDFRPCTQVRMAHTLRL